jgi:hypothetical protein
MVSKFKSSNNNLNVPFVKITSLDKDIDKSQSFDKKFSFKPINFKVYENKNNKQYSLPLPKKILPEELRDKPLKRITLKIIRWE